MLTWNVFNYNINRRKIEQYNVFSHSGFVNGVKSARKENGTIEDFSDAVKSVAMYYFWCKAEYEIELCSWPAYITTKETERIKATETPKYRQCIDVEDSVKVDVYRQLATNWDHFIKYCWESVIE